LILFTVNNDIKKEDLKLRSLWLSLGLLFREAAVDTDDFQLA